MKAFTVQPDGTMKNIPLRRLPADAWQSLQGQDVGDISGAVDIVKLYDRVPWLNRGVDLISEAVADIPREYHAISTGDEVEDEPDFGFELDVESLLNELTGDLLLHGCAYLFVKRNAFKLLGVQRLYPKTVQPKYDEEKGLVGYTRTVNGKTVPLELEDVIYIPVPNRGGETGHGKSKAYAALRAAGMLDNIDAYGGKLFEQGTIRPNIVWAEGEPPPADIERLQSFFDRLMTGLKNAFRTVAVRGKMGMMTFGEVPSDLAMPELTDKKREDIATALGIPHSLLFSNAANFATARQDDLHFYDKTIVPLAKLILRSLSRGLFELYGYELRPHPEMLEIYQHLEAEKAEALAMMHDRHVIDTNEFRDAMNYEPVDGLSEAESDLIGWSAARAGEPEPQPGMVPGAAAQAPAENAQDAIMEMRKWRRFIEKRVASGKAVRDFDTRHIPATLKAAINGALSEAQTPDARKAVFTSAERFASYP